MTDLSMVEARSEAFAGRMADMLNGAGLVLMTSIGHQVGLFDTMAGLKPSTSQEIARVAGLNERYVREWLGAMVTGTVVEYEPLAQTYSLPPEHSAWLTRAAGTNNLALQAQYVPLLAQVEAPLIDCFRSGGGVPYSEFPGFQQLMAEDSGAVHDAALIDVILPLVSELPGQLSDGIDVADVGCGSGHAINLMARAFPNSRFVGFDFSEEGVERGRTEAANWGLENVRFEARDVTNLGVSERFDLITAFDAIHDQSQPALVLSGIAAALKPDGSFLMVDFGASSNVEENREFPMAPLMYTISCMHCMTVSLALGGAGLGAMWGVQTAIAMLAEAGFGKVDVKRIDDDPFNAYFIATKS